MPPDLNCCPQQTVIHTHIHSRHANHVVQWNECWQMKTIQIDEITGIWSYLQTIDWSERWLWGLGAFHFLCALLTTVTRSRGTLQSIHFGIMLLLVYSAEIINEWASKNYRLFSKEQYFDSRGLFISIVFSVPILLNCLIIVMLWLWNVGNFISKVKRLKYKQQARAQGRKSSGNTSSSNSDAKETKKVKWGSNWPRSHPTINPFIMSCLP